MTAARGFIDLFGLPMKVRGLKQGSGTRQPGPGSEEGPRAPLIAGRTLEARVPVIAIISADDPRVLDYRAVREPDLVRRRGLFIAEGRLVVARLLALPHYTIR